MDESTEEILVSFAFATAFGIPAVLAGIGFEWILQNTSTTLSSSAGPIGIELLSNLVGCFLMGILVRFPRLKRGRRKMLYIGLASGYCGGVTTISGWQVQASLEILRPQIMDGLLALLVGFCTFFSSFKFGLHLGKVAKRLYRKRYKKKPKNTTQPESIQPTQTISPWRWHWEHILAISAATTLWAFFGLLFVFVKPSRTWSGAAFLAPWGTGIRWYISRWNVIWPRFRLPTFIVNFIGSTLYAILFVLKCKEESAKHALASSILSALIIGFCGTMTTASTFTSELRDIKNPKWAYLYGFATVIGIQASCLLVFGITESVSDIDLYLDDYR